MSIRANFQERIFNMKKVSLFALALTTTASTWAAAQAPVAVAAPGAVPVANPCPCPKAFQGFHLGGNVGYGVGYVKTAVSSGVPAGSTYLKNNLGVNGFDGGLNVGYTHRFGNFGLGLEGVFNWASTKGQLSTNFGFTAPTYFVDKLQMRNSIQLRANLSYVICNLVAPKIILGWDNSEWRRTLTTNAAGTPATTLGNQKKRLNSFLFGAGVDFLLAKHVIAGFEYTGTTGATMKTGPINNAVAPANFAFTAKPQYNKFALTIKFIY
jgi:opacity protein-like surface antigen